jgi:hypothetical protein
MLFMVVERFADNDMLPVYQRLKDGGRTMPEGLRYVDSWIAADFSACFQLMEADDPALFNTWLLMWRGLGMTCEVVPVSPSARIREAVAPYLS